MQQPKAEPFVYAAGVVFVVYDQADLALVIRSFIMWLAFSECTHGSF